MTDSTPTGSAAQALAGNPADPASVGASNTGAPAPASAPAPDSPYAWADGFTKAELKGVVEKKGWKSAEAALESYVNLERLNSGDKVVLPKDATDQAAWDNVYNKLGRPETPDAYKFPEGVDEKTAKALAPELHKIGVTQAQAEALARLDIQRVTQLQEAETTRLLADQDAGMNKLRQEWGPKFNENVEITRRAMRAEGMTVDEVTKMMAAIGTEKVMRLLSRTGQTVREDNSAGIGDTESLGFAMTPNRAAAEKAKLMADPLFTKRWSKGEAAAKRQIDTLNKIITDSRQ